MKVLLVRPKAKMQLSNIPIKVEPLELEVLAARLEQDNIAYEIKDCLISGEALIKTVRRQKPTHVVFTSYITTVDEIIKQSKAIKDEFSDISIIVGGPHAIRNYSDFKVKDIDVVVHSGGTDTIIAVLKANKLEDLKGITYNSNNNWVVNAKALDDSGRDLVPIRTHFINNKRKWRYLEHKEIALVKTAYGCPYNCEFCYCRLMEKSYYPRDIEKVLEEIEGLPTDKIWIVDDTFLIDKTRIRSFINGIKERKIKKSFLIYSRADFIVANPDLMKELREVGIVEVIIGLEAVSNDELKTYNKEIGVDSNRRCIDILDNAKIKATGLFIFPIDATFETVKKNLKFVKETRLYNATYSIFTPLKGTKMYEEYKHKITRKKSRYYDFLHLVLSPSKIGRFRYMLYFYLLSIGSFYYMLKQRRVKEDINGSMG